MNDLAPRARFDALSAILGLDEDAVSAIRQSINHLLPRLRDLAALWDKALGGEAATLILGEINPERRSELQSRMASFIFRTINCVFDDDYCDYAQSFAADISVPPRLIPLALAVAQDFAVRAVAESIEDRQALSRTVVAWTRLVSVLREFAAGA